MPQNQEFVTIKQASERLQVSPRTIRRWILDIGTKDITRGTAKRHSLQVDITALKQHKGQEAQRTQQAHGAEKAQKAQWTPLIKPAKIERKKGRVDTTDTRGTKGTTDKVDITDTQDIVPRDQYMSVLESKNEIIRKQDQHIATLESQLQNEREQRKRSDVLLAETLQKIPRLEAPEPSQNKKRKKFLGIF